MRAEGSPSLHVPKAPAGPQLSWLPGRAARQLEASGESAASSAAGEPPEKKLRLTGKGPAVRIDPDTMAQAIDSGLEDEVIEELKRLSAARDDDEWVSDTASTGADLDDVARSEIIQSSFQIRTFHKSVTT